MKNLRNKKKIAGEKARWIQKCADGGMHPKQIAHTVGLDYLTVKQYLRLASCIGKESKLNQLKAEE